MTLLENMTLLEKLLSLNEPQFVKDIEQWSYLEALDLSEEDGEALIAIATDKSLFDAQETWFARIHAWRALSNLQYKPALEPLLPLFIDDFDWIWEELPYFYNSFGLSAIPVLSEAIQDRQRHLEIRMFAASSLELIGAQSAEAREQAIAALSGGLSTYKRNDRELNGRIVTSLVKLKAVEAFDLLKAAHDDDCVNTMHYGAWPSVLVGLGLKQKSDFTPKELAPLDKDFLSLFQFQDEIKRLRNDSDVCFTAAKSPPQKTRGFGHLKQAAQAQKAQKRKNKKRNR